jgi:hypothetical protein
MEDTDRFEKFVTDAQAADERMERTGRGYAAADVYVYIEARLAGRREVPPKPISWTSRGRPA